MQPCTEKMDIGQLQRDIPKWMKWLSDDSAAEWEIFLRTPIQDCSREWQLQKLSRMGQPTVPMHTDDEIHGGITQTQTSSAVSTYYVIAITQLRGQCVRYCTRHKGT